MMERRENSERAELGPLPIATATRSSRLAVTLQWYGRRLTWPVLSGLLTIADLVVVLLLGIVAFVAYVGAVLDGWAQWDRYVAAMVLTLGFAGLMWQVAGVNDPRRLSRMHFHTGAVCALWFAALLLTGAAGFLIKIAVDFSRTWAVAWLLLGAGGLVMNRIILGRAARSWRQHAMLARRLAVIADAATLPSLRESLAAEAMVNMFDLRRVVVTRDETTAALAAAVDEVMSLARTSPFDVVLVAARTGGSDGLGAAVDPLRDLPADLWITISEGSVSLRRIGVREVGSLAVFELEVAPMKDWAALLKAIEDRLLASTLLLLCSPVLLIAALAIKLETRGPILFRQKRFGFNGLPIDVLKLRTMHVEQADPTGEISTAPIDPRVTRVGRILRKSSIDELPQLWNVIEGSMSMVGPRAHPVRMRIAERLYHEMFAHYAARHKVKPGITGLAQVHGNRGQVDSEAKARDRLHYDLAYVREWSIWLDLKILAKTPLTLLRGDNAY